MNKATNWRSRIGQQRDWVWRGWQIRYSFIRAKTNPHKPAVIFIHGFGAAIEHWRHNLAAIAEHHTVYAVDLVGFGASVKAPTQYNVSLWVEQIHDFWQTLIAQPVILVGNSTGSLVCLNYAFCYPEMLRGIVMISLPDVSLRQANVPPLLQPWVARIENLFASPLLINTIFKFIRRRSTIKRVLKFAYPQTKIIDDELIDIIAAPPQDIDANQTFDSLFRAVRQPGFAPAVKDILPQLDLDILLIWGECDRIISPDLAQLYAQLNSKIKLVKLKGAGHCLHDESPQEFNQILLEWLAMMASKPSI